MALIIEEPFLWRCLEKPVSCGRPSFHINTLRLQKTTRASKVWLDRPLRTVSTGAYLGHSAASPVCFEDAPYTSRVCFNLLFYSRGLEGNYCRNPDNDIQPWCYTTDPDTKWEYCKVPICGDKPGPGQWDTSHCTEHTVLSTGQSTFNINDITFVQSRKLQDYFKQETLTPCSHQNLSVCGAVLVCFCLKCICIYCTVG